MEKIIVSILIYSLLFIFSSNIALADLEIIGQGQTPSSPIRIIVNPPGGVTEIIFTLENTGNEVVFSTPAILCPFDTLTVSFFDLPIEIPPQSSRQIQVRFSDLSGGVGIEDVIECLILDKNFEASIFVKIMNPLELPDFGTLDVDLRFEPEQRNTEATQFLIDYETNLKLDITLSGLTIRSDLGWGVTGLEFAILKLVGIIGAFDVENEFVFAVPFDFQQQVLADAQATFVKKRVKVRFDLIGLTVENLAVFENTKFLHPFFDNAEALEAIQTPSFRFGDLLTLKGKTPLDVPITLAFGICLDPFLSNRIKKRSFSGRVCEVDQLAFTVTQLRLGAVEVGGVRLSLAFEFRPQKILKGSLSLQTRLFDMLNIRSNFAFTPDSFSLRSVSLTASTPLQLLVFSFDDEQALSSAFASFRFSINDTQLSTSLRMTPDGPSSLSTSVDIPTDMGRITSNVNFSKASKQQGLTYSRANFSWRQTYDSLQGNIQISFSQKGLENARANLSLSF